MPKQFNWEMTYPGPDGKLGTKDDLMVENEMHVPVHKVVRIDLTSKDVIHSFFVPNLRLKQDAVPGRLTTCGSRRRRPDNTRSHARSCAVLDIRA